MSNSGNLYENDRYVVEIVDDIYVEAHGATYAEGYGVRNKETGVAEIITNTLPDAISACEQLDLAMEGEVWKWARINFEADQMERGEAEDPEVH